MQSWRSKTNEGVQFVLHLNLEKQNSNFYLDKKYMTEFKVVVRLSVQLESMKLEPFILTLCT